MRWTDLPVASPVRALADWHAAEQARGRIAPGALAAFVARAGDTLPDAPWVLLGDVAAETVQRHVAASALERGGLLLGIPIAARVDGPVVAVHVTAAVPGLDDDATALSLRLGTSVWSRASAALAPGEAIVGWFHSHPGIGAFFSDTDRRTQAAFFAQPYGLGWVIDPLRCEHAWFAGREARPLPAGAVVRGR